jgi:polyhydroxybutyrate depolymerase
MIRSSAARHPRLAHGLTWGVLAALALFLSLACGSTGTDAPDASAAGRPAPAASGQSPTRSFVYRGPTEVPTRNCTAVQVAARLPPIVHRPSWLGTAKKVPLLIALHGALSGPQNMQGLSHFEELADRYGFVVVFPGSCNDLHPWGPVQDFTYLQALIPQLIATQNIDPSRVYVAGYSAGGYETWLTGCRLSRTVAAIAIVSGAMNGRLYTSCSLARPVSELLMVGTADGTRFSGIPGRLPSPFQTTGRWRMLNGCAPAPVAATAPLPVVSQQVWSACTDRSAVSLVLVQGGHHIWPPYGPGAPTNYSASLTVWSFLSSHTAAPLSLTTSDARLVSLRASPTRRGATRFTATLRVAEPLTVVATLGSSQARRRTIYLTRLGPRTVTVSWSFHVPAGRSYRVALTFRDSYGRTRRVTRSVVS